jgi:ribose 5-phosphate isomerase B
MNIGIGADHRGFKLKSSIIRFLTKNGHKVIDFGTYSRDSIDYPDIGFEVARAIIRKKIKYGVLLCNTGQGMAMTANKVKGIRAAVCMKPEIARLTRAHNNANVLVLPAGFLKFNKATRKIIDNFLNTKFEGGRHRRRLNIMKRYENRHLRLPR